LPDEILIIKLDDLISQTKELLKSQTGLKSFAWQIEALISLTIKVEKEIYPFTEQLLNLCFELQDFKLCWQTRKNAVDLVYSLVAILDQDIAEHKNSIFEFVGRLWLDKQKPVRDASLETLTLLKQTFPEDPELNTSSSFVEFKNHTKL